MYIAGGVSTILQEMYKNEKIIAEEQAGFRAGRSRKSRSSTYAFSVRDISSTSKTSTMSSKTSRRPSTGFGMQLCGQP